MSKPRQPRRHHTNPEMLLKRFTDDNGKLYVFDKSEPKKDIQYRSPKGVFWEPHFYTSRTVDGTKDTSLEDDFAKLESDTDPIIEKIVSATRKGNNPSLTEEEKNIWDRFSNTQLIRTPDFWQKFDIGKILDNQREIHITEIENTRPLTSEEYQYLNDPKQRTRETQKVKVDALKIGNPKYLEFLSNAGLCFAKIISQKKSFIIGSLPITKITYSTQNPFSNLRAAVWLPIAHDIAITPFFIKGEEKVVPIADKNVRRINEAITRQSTIIAGRSEKLIRSLAFPR